jgi:hypothetical protein
VSQGRAPGATIGLSGRLAGCVDRSGDHVTTGGRRAHALYDTGTSVGETDRVSGLRRCEGLHGAPGGFLVADDDPEEARLQHVLSSATLRARLRAAFRLCWSGGPGEHDAGEAVSGGADHMPDDDALAVWQIDDVPGVGGTVELHDEAGGVVLIHDDDAKRGHRAERIRASVVCR